MKGKISTAWAALNPRERLIIVSGVTVLSVVVFYLFAWEPMRKESALLRENLPVLRQTAEWMKQKKPEAEKLRSQVDTALKNVKDAETFIKQKFETSGAVNLAVKKIENDKVSVVAGSIEPKKLFEIIGKLRKDGLIAASAMKIEGLPDGVNVMADGVFVRLKGDGA
ncbi:MAG: type II secretion system protein M [Nitrospinae bacterium]|nr:type II secretion system protein M [Nitrospinota bacterium]